MMMMMTMTTTTMLSFHNQWNNHPFIHWFQWRDSVKWRQPTSTILHGDSSYPKQNSDEDEEEGEKKEKKITVTIIMITIPGGSGMMSATFDYKIPKAIIYSLLSATVLGFERNPNPIHDTHCTIVAFACVCCIGFLSLESRGRETRLLVLLCAVAAASRFCFGGSWCSRRKRTQDLWKWRTRSVLFLSFPSFVSFLYCCSWTRS